MKLTDWFDRQPFLVKLLVMVPAWPAVMLGWRVMLLVYVFACPDEASIL